MEGHYPKAGEGTHSGCLGFFLAATLRCPEILPLFFFFLPYSMAANPSLSCAYFAPFCTLSVALLTNPPPLPPGTNLGCSNRITSEQLPDGAKKSIRTAARSP